MSSREYTPLSGTHQRQYWSSHLRFIMVAVGAAVGLGNLWRFPFEAGSNGGGAFVFVYLICVLAIGVPILIAELTIGRLGGGSAVGSILAIARRHGASSYWSVGGWIAITGGFLILAFYSVIAGWIIAYLPDVITGQFAGISAGEAEKKLAALFADPVRLTFCHGLFMLVTVGIVAGGVTRGIERAATYLMPTFAVMLIALTVTSLMVGDAAAAVRFLFVPDFSAITTDVMISAVGQAFFSLSLGAATMITYGAYLDGEVKIPHSSLVIAGCDTAVALTAGLAIFPIVFGFGLDPGAGPGLLLVTLPVAFGQIPGALGPVFGTAFFMLALFAAITSSISMLEVGVARILERTRMTRLWASCVLGLVAFVLGMACVLSLNIWSGVHPLGAVPLFADKGFLDVLDTLTAKILLPTSGLLCALFAGWVVSRHASAEELGFARSVIYRVWQSLIRYACPLAIAAILAFGIF